MTQPREWTVDEVGELVTGVQLLRTPAELSSALHRDVAEIEAKMAALGLATDGSLRRKRQQ
jgi:hypothetical protein